MSFFSFAFLENAMSFQGYLKYIPIFCLAWYIACSNKLIFHRFTNQNIVISVLFSFLLIIFLLGVQYNQYERSEVYTADTSRVVTFLNSVKRQSESRRYSYQ